VSRLHHFASGSIPHGKDVIEAVSPSEGAIRLFDDHPTKRTQHRKQCCPIEAREPLRAQEVEIEAPYPVNVAVRADDSRKGQVTFWARSLPRPSAVFEKNRFGGELPNALALGAKRRLNHVCDPLAIRAAEMSLLRRTFDGHSGSL